MKITDFGLARAVDDVGLTQTGIVAGTPQFMAPEQANGETIDLRSDLFSLGSVLYMLCTGRPPFRATTTMGLLKRICEETPRPIRELNPEVPDWLESIIAKLLAKRPEDRYQSAKDVAELLEQWLAYVQRPTAVPRPSSPMAGPVVTSVESLAVDSQTADSRRPLLWGDYARSVRFSGATDKAFDLAVASLTAAGFRLNDRTESQLRMSGPGLNRLRGNALAAASSVNVNHQNGALRLTASLGTIQKLHGGLFASVVMLFVFILIAAIASAPSVGGRIQTPGSALDNTMIQLLHKLLNALAAFAWIIAIAAIWSRRTVFRTYDDFVENLRWADGPPGATSVPGLGPQTVFQRTVTTYITTAAELSTFAGQLSLGPKGTLALSDRQLSLSHVGRTTVIPFDAIRDLSIGHFPRWMNLSRRLDFISVTYEIAGQTERILIAPFHKVFGVPGHFNKFVREWFDSIRAAITAATGHAPRNTAADQLGVPVSSPARFLIGGVAALMIMMMASTGVLGFPEIVILVTLGVTLVVFLWKRQPRQPAACVSGGLRTMMPSWWHWLLFAIWGLFFFVFVDAQSTIPFSVHQMAIGIVLAGCIAPLALIVCAWWQKRRTGDWALTLLRSPPGHLLRQPLLWFFLVNTAYWGWRQATCGEIEIQVNDRDLNVSVMGPSLPQASSYSGDFYPLRVKPGKYNWAVRHNQSDVANGVVDVTPRTRQIIKVDSPYPVGQADAACLPGRWELQYQYQGDSSNTVPGTTTSDAGPDLAYIDVSADGTIAVHSWRLVNALEALRTDKPGVAVTVPFHAAANYHFQISSPPDRGPKWIDVSIIEQGRMIPVARGIFTADKQRVSLRLAAANDKRPLNWEPSPVAKAGLKLIYERLNDFSVNANEITVQFARPCALTQLQGDWEVENEAELAMSLGLDPAKLKEEGSSLRVNVAGNRMTYSKLFKETDYRPPLKEPVLVYLDTAKQTPHITLIQLQGEVKKGIDEGVYQIDGDQFRIYLTKDGKVSEALTSQPADLVLRRVVDGISVR